MPDRRADVTRRKFLTISAAGLCAAKLAGLTSAWAEEQEQIRNPEGIPIRPLGKTGVKVPILCLGGHHVGSVKNDDDAIRLVRYAIDHGVTFLDNAWEYHHGRSEEIVGRALKDGYRDKAFVMTKTHGRDKQSTQQQIEDSLRRLQVDTIDLCQVHEVIYPDDPTRFFAADGGIEALLKAKQDGKVRFIGFTGHKDPDLFTEMLQLREDWDTVQMPVNAFDPHYRSFIKSLMPMLQDRQIGILAMKTMGAGHLLKSGLITARQALRYAWSLPVASVVSGMDSLDLLKQNIDSARQFVPMTQVEREALLKRTASAGQDGKWEKYKTANTFDGWYGRTIHRGEPPAAL